LFFLATISTFLFFLLIKNGAERVYYLLKPDTNKINPKYIFLFFGQKTLIDFGESWKNYLLFVLFFIFISYLLTAFSYYYRNYFSNRVVNDLKKKSINKLFKLEEKVAKGKEKEAFGAIHTWPKELGYHFVFLPDSFYIFFLTAIFAFYEIKFASSVTI